MSTHYLGFSSVKRNAKEIGARAHRALLDRVPMLKNRQWLIEQYVRTQRSLSNIAKELGVAPSTVNTTFGSLGIPVRRYPKLLDKKWLRQEYVVERLSLEKIGRLADHTGAVSLATARRYMIKRGIPRRKSGGDMRWA